jgi:choline dehydrogenase-like flavoprotein
VNTAEFDYVIVGAGSAGCALAARLSEDKDIRVCLFEAGGSDSDPLIHIPLGMGKMREKRLHDWGLDTEPVPGLAGRRMAAIRGKVIGGSGALNFLTHVRGNKGDYARWAQKGCTGWSYDAVLPYFKKLERWQEGADDYRGGDGPIAVRRAASPDPIFEAMFEAAVEAGHPTTADYNGAQQDGIGTSQLAIGNGRRSSSATGYLRPALKRPNLTLITGALARRVMLDGTRAIGIEYETNGTAEQARAAREVILCAGTFNSPHLLMLSGIGPAQMLRAQGIPIALDAPGVGQNLQDHVYAFVAYQRKEPGPFVGALRWDRMTLAMAQAQAFGTGPATVPPTRLMAFLKTRPELTVPDIQFFCGANPRIPHLWFPGWKAAPQDGFELAPVLLHPECAGHVALASADPRAPVRIHQNVLSTASEVRTLREGVKLARDLLSRKPLDRYRGRAVIPGDEVKTDAEIDAWIPKAAIAAFHPAGTCAMGVGPDAVLDPELRVRGTQALRVVDASAMPDLTSGNINAVVVMMAEKAADLIRAG